MCCSTLHCMVQFHMLQDWRCHVQRKVCRTISVLKVHTENLHGWLRNTALAFCVGISVCFCISSTVRFRPCNPWHSDFISVSSVYLTLRENTASLYLYSISIVCIITYNKWKHGKVKFYPAEQYGSYVKDVFSDLRFLSVLSLALELIHLLGFCSVPI